MFEELSDAALIDDMGVVARAESTAIARRLALIGELDARREQELAETIFWTTDPFEAVAAEISAAQNVSRGRAAGQIRNARALRDRLPKVAAVFATGAIDFRVVLTIIARTENVEADVMPLLDEALARRAVKWMRLSGPKLLDRIDQWVAKTDPEAVRVPPEADESRSIHVEPTTPGMAAVWGTMHACDAAAFSQRLDAVAATVCDADPRTHQQRRTDACGALGRLQYHLDCRCGSPDCPADGIPSAAADVVIHVLADQGTVDGTSDEPGYLPGFGIQPAETVRDLAGTAKIKPLTVPGDEPESGYRPSTRLAEFVRWRDLTCRFPGCDARATAADIDHTAPYPSGPTHPSNNKLYCRTHHLIKTFHTGPSGWTDLQLPDGTVVFTSPTGHTYSTEPHGGALFPALAQPTGELSIPQPEEPSAHRAVMMPTRKQTREQDRRDRIVAERRERAELIAEQQRQHQAWLAANYEPPPF